MEVAGAESMFENQQVEVPELKDDEEERSADIFLSGSDE